MTIKFLEKEFEIGKEFFLLLVPVLLILFGALGLFLQKGDRAMVFKAETSNGSEGSAMTSGPTVMAGTGIPATPALQDEIHVYVVGCVNNPGIVTLKKGQMIDDAIRLAGGATEEADLININLVYKLKENVTIKILPRATAADSGSADGAIGSAHWVSSDANGASGVVSDRDLGKDQPAFQTIAEAGTGVLLDTGNGVAAGAGAKTAIINLNTATLEQLDSLPGIGMETAKDIVATREKIGGFKIIQEIMQVPGIKESRFNKIKDMISVD